MKNFIELEVDKQYFAYYNSTIVIFKIIKIGNYKNTIEYNREIIAFNNDYFPALSYFIYGSAFHSYIIGETTVNTIDELKELNPEYFI